jgi:hypothetical protein
MGTSVLTYPLLNTIRVVIVFCFDLSLIKYNPCSYCFLGLRFEYPRFCSGSAKANKNGFIRC